MRDASEIRAEIEACDERCGLVAGSNTGYWVGAEDALSWVLGEGVAPSDDGEDDYEDEDEDEDGFCL